MSQPGLLSPIDFAGYAVGVGGAHTGHGGQGMSHRALFFLHRQELARLRQCEANARRVQNVFRRQAAASYAKAQERTRRVWAAAYTTLLAEI